MATQTSAHSKSVCHTKSCIYTTQIKRMATVQMDRPTLTTMILVVILIIIIETAAENSSLRSDFLQTLLTRRNRPVPLAVEWATPVQISPCMASTPPRFDQIMETWAKDDIKGFWEMLIQENLYLSTEEGDQGRLPLLILSTRQRKHKRRPAIVILHNTKKCKEWMRPLVEAFASQGYIAIGVDSRYHGERVMNTTTYEDALIESWENGDMMPFIYDTVWDLIKLNDYLAQRDDIDHSRIGITGESLGGMHAWFAAFVDTRYLVVVPIIGVQGFRWAIDNDKWQARVDSMKPVFSEAAVDLGKMDIDKEVVEKVWDRITPGLVSKFDSPNTIPAMAPRPLRILSGAEDPRCPIGGLDTPVSKARDTYEEANCPENFEWIAHPGNGHQMTPLMVKEASDWFKKFL